MSGTRKAFRDAVREALGGDAALDGATGYKNWALPVDAKQLPAFTILTPSERIDLSTGDSADRMLELVVVLRCRGGEDIEDDLDVYADAIEACVIGVFQSWPEELPFFQATGVRTAIKGGEEKRHAEVEVTFSVLRFADEGAQP